MKRFMAGLWVCLLLATQAQGHQQNESLVSILFNQRTGMIEVAHRFYIHDAEHVVKRVVGKTADLLSNPTTQSEFAQYVVNHISILVDADSESGFELLGYEVQGKFFWVYQEKPYTAKPHQVDIGYDPQMEVWPSKRTVVNIEGTGGPIRSMELTPSQPSGSLVF